MLERWSPLTELDRIVNEMNRLLGETIERGRMLPRALVSRPATDVYDTPEAIVIKLAVPGARPDDLEVTLEQNTVTVRGRYGYALSEEEAKRATWYRREIGTGQFAESIVLPAPVDAEHAQATVENGIVTLTFPKAEQARVKRIAVQAGQPRSS
ncbi:Hsp20/alpha crystallin family protein [Thermomicrobiaceae bacterium CFH 74404]|uniref:Hsp20/alpha crystallin family protein n=1 Tax=Thermalbibacter longus TaxID=2951981 RepID=A0AA42B936_9BACT|nr:Hsp20/alpha crystallin family protein [Thermalbibacter longus]MCM8747557.1 Hsp20/alpha crystallin family protein [Thermalbibacter longus]